jgi:hypothetical protein
MMVTLRPWSFPAVWWRATSQAVETHHEAVHLLAMPCGCFYYFNIYYQMSVALKELLIYFASFMNSVWMNQWCTGV